MSNFRYYEAISSLTGGVSLPPGPPPQYNPDGPLAQIDWWNDGRFDLHNRAPGDNAAHSGEFFVAPHVGEGNGNGTELNPWNLRWAVDNAGTASIPAGSRVHCAGGNYHTNFRDVEIKNTGGSYRPSHDGYIAFLGPDPALGGPRAELTGARDWGFYLKENAHWLIFARWLMKHPTLNSTYRQYWANMPQGPSGDAYWYYDTWLNNNYGINNHHSEATAFGGVGYGLESNPASYPHHLYGVNLEIDGWGRGFDTNTFGPLASIGCTTLDNGHFSPVGSSNMSLNWVNNGTQIANGPGQEEPIISTAKGDLYQLVFGHISHKSYHLGPSWGIGGTYVSDGNGDISPTDGNSSTAANGQPRGKCLKSNCVIFGNGGMGMTGFGSAVDGVWQVNNTIHDNGFHHWIVHSDIVSANGVPFDDVDPNIHSGILNHCFNAYGSGNGAGASNDMVSQSYASAAGSSQTYSYINGNIVATGWWQSVALRHWGDNHSVYGDGNFVQGGDVFDSATATYGDPQFVNRDPFNFNANDPRLLVGSPALNAAYMNDLWFDFDIHGNSYVDNGSGRTSAGAYATPVTI